MEFLFSIFLLLYLGSSKNEAEKTGSNDKDGSKDDEDDETKRFDLFCERYNFTPRERDVMRLLISSDESMKNISSELKISERML
jgi:DNA-binding NarL/FixJ family response regulator